MEETQNIPSLHTYCKDVALIWYMGGFSVKKDFRKDCYPPSPFRADILRKFKFRQSLEPAQPEVS